MRKWILTTPRLEVATLVVAAGGLRAWSGQGWLWVALNFALLLGCILPAMSCCVNLKHLFRMRFDPEYRRKEERLDAICGSFAQMAEHVQQTYGAVIDGGGERLQSLAAEFDEKFPDDEMLAEIDGTDRGLRLVKRPLGADGPRSIHWCSRTVASAQPKSRPIPSTSSGQALCSSRRLSHPWP